MFVAVAVVGVDAVDTPASILTGMLGAVVNIMLTRLTHEPCERQMIHVQYTSKSLRPCTDYVYLLEWVTETSRLFIGIKYKLKQKSTASRQTVNE